VGDEVRLDVGKDHSALLYGLVTATSKVGNTISIFVTFHVLAFFDFNQKEGAVNVGLPLYALIACYVVVPVLTMFVGAAMLRGYRLDAASHDAIRATLAERDLALEGIVENAESLGGPILPPSAEPGLNPGE
jgi:Na+/melibiose symporter-like transporter